MLLTWINFTSQLETFESKSMEYVKKLGGWSKNSPLLSRNRKLGKNLIQKSTTGDTLIRTSLLDARTGISENKIKGVVFGLMIPNDRGITNSYHIIVMIYDGNF